MKKTITANVSGTVFHIEEDAYERLNAYLSSIRARLDEQGRDEIMSDIEARIAELFNEQLRGKHEVVTINDVEHVVGVMGQPEDYGDGRAQQDAPSGQKSTAGQSGYKRLFRDPVDKWVAGVIGGLSTYIGMDPLWLRLIIILFILLGSGAPILLYVLLWILVPKAETAADRLRMEGEPVNVDNLKRAFEEGGKRVAEDAKEMGRRWEREARSRAPGAGSVIGKLIGAAIVVLGFSMLVGLVTSAAGGAFGLWHASWGSAGMGPFDLGALLFESREHAIWLFVGVLVLALIPVLGLLLAGFRLLLGTRAPAWLGWTLAFFWFAALVPTIIMGLSLAREFHRGNSVRDEVVLETPLDGMLYLDAIEPSTADGSWSVRYDNGWAEWDLDGLVAEDGRIQLDAARIDVEPSPDSLFRLVLIRESRGRTAKDAMAKASGIQTTYSQEGAALRVSPLVSFAADDKLRGQDARFTLLVPEGKAVFLRPGCRAVIHDIDNVTNVRDRDMIGKPWRMTSKGLVEGAPDTPPGEPLDAPEATPAPSKSERQHPASTSAELPHMQLPSLVNLLRARI